MSAAPDPASQRSDPVRVGETIAGRYRIESVLGRGGMGVVMVATHLRLQQRVAIKFLRRDLPAGPVAFARFVREAQALASLRGPHVVRVMDVAELENGEPYFVMELLEGIDLRQVMDERGRLPVPEAVGYVLQACEAVAEAHAKGIVHRDLKPSNLFLCPQGDGSQLLKVLDFGVSKLGAAAKDAGLDDRSLTDTGELLGSPKYMAPEQIRGAKGIEPRTDVWALGAILYELTTGSAPFTGDTKAAVLASVAADSPPKLRELQADIPAELESVVLRCLQKQLDLRLGSVAELATALAPFVDNGAEIAKRIRRSYGQGSPPDSKPSAAVLAPHGTEATDVTGTFRSVFGERPPGAERRPAWPLFALLGVLGVLVLGILRATSMDGSQVSSPASAPSPIPVAPAPTASTPVSPVTATPPVAPPREQTSATASTASSVRSVAPPRPLSSAPRPQKRLDAVFADGALDRK